VVGCQGEIRWDKTKPDETPRKLLDSAKITSRGWIPQISLRQGLESAYAWYQATGSAGVESL
jgi:GDP-L-fucose synthase